MRRFGYLHGFASSPKTKKGIELEKLFRERGLPFELPELNRPSFARLSAGEALAAIDEMDARAGAEDRWCLVGSSFGGYLAARWAERRPERVERLVLLCPGFDLVKRWPNIVGHEKLAEWRRTGWLEFPDAEGKPVPVHWAFFEECGTLPPEPVPRCPTLIIHGVRDEIVPIETSRAYAAKHPHVRLIEVEDDHALLASMERIQREVLAYFGC